jgi:hypothetical protein
MDAERQDAEMSEERALIELASEIANRYEPLSLKEAIRYIRTIHQAGYDAALKKAREEVEADKAKLIEALMQTLPILRRHRKSMGQIPRPGTDPTFFHTLTYEGDIKELQKARRIHRNIRDVLAEMTRKEKGGGTDVPLKD